jgi:hypothetical protein
MIQTCLTPFGASLINVAPQILDDMKGSVTEPKLAQYLKEIPSESPLLSIYSDNKEMAPALVPAFHKSACKILGNRSELLLAGARSRMEATEVPLHGRAPITSADYFHSIICQMVIGGNLVTSAQTEIHSNDSLLLQELRVVALSDRHILGVLRRLFDNDEEGLLAWLQSQDDRMLHLLGILLRQETFMLNADPSMERRIFDEEDLCEELINLVLYGSPYGQPVEILKGLTDGLKKLADAGYDNNAIIRTYTLFLGHWSRGSIDPAIDYDEDIENDEDYRESGGFFDRGLLILSSVISDLAHYEHYDVWFLATELGLLTYSCEWETIESYINVLRRARADGIDVVPTIEEGSVNLGGKVRPVSVESLRRHEMDLLFLDQTAENYQLPFDYSDEDEEIDDKVN